jgi:hypothetical protein
LNSNLKKYSFNLDKKSPKGINIDSGGQYIDLDLLDQMTSVVQSCLIESFGKDGTIPITIQKQAQCMEVSFEPKIIRKCLFVKIPTDWFWSKVDPNMQLLNDKAPDSGCIKKGQDAVNSCWWRAGISDYNIIVVTPNLYMYADPLVKLITTCIDPWSNRTLSLCMMKAINLTKN